MKISYLGTETEVTVEYMLDKIENLFTDYKESEDEVYRREVRCLVSSINKKIDDLKGMERVDKKKV